MGIVWRGLDRLITALTRDKTPIIIRNIGLIADVLLPSIKSATPKRTGKLASTMLIRAPNPLRREITEEQAYGILVRRGVQGGYPIFPAFRKALWWPGLSHPIAYVPKHPGQQANPYHEIGVSNAMPKIKPYLAGIGDAIVIDIAK